MLPQTHIVLGLLFAGLLSATNQFSFLALMIIYTSSVLIDVDHWFIYVKRTGKHGLFDFSYYRWFIEHKKRRKAILEKNPKAELPKFLCVFHTIEFFALIILLSLKFPFFYYVLVGISFHLLFDYIVNNLIEKEYGNEISLIYALLGK